MKTKLSALFLCPNFNHLVSRIMSQDIHIKKGLDIQLVGAAVREIAPATPPKNYRIQLEDFHGLTPKMLKKTGETVQSGEPLFCDKDQPEVVVVAPVSGLVQEIHRGERRRILSVDILADSEQKQVKHAVLDLSVAQADHIKSLLLTAGCWPLIKQRPYDVIAGVQTTPKAIFIAGLDTAPLAAELDFILKDQVAEVQTAVTALSKLAPVVHVSVPAEGSTVFSGLKDCQLHRVSGVHPAGLVGTLINRVDPVNKGEVVWTIQAADLAIIGKVIAQGIYDSTRTVAFAGASFEKNQYISLKQGASLFEALKQFGLKTGARVINGNVLTGKKSNKEGYLGFYNTTVTAIPEGDDYEFFGWNKPVTEKVSITRALTFSWLFPKKKYNLTTNTNGEHRAFVVTGHYEQVFPLDIYPMQLLKACMIKDLDEMEALGLYEVAPEDFSLTEFVCISKQPHQQIIREGLDLLQQEIG
ncbi:MAG: hypothetical protein RL501_150 [Bacteroidota bacterium]